VSAHALSVTSLAAVTCQITFYGDNDSQWEMGNFTPHQNRSSPKSRGPLLLCKIWSRSGLGFLPPPPHVYEVTRLLCCASDSSLTALPATSLTALPATSLTALPATSLTALPATKTEYIKRRRFAQEFAGRENKSVRFHPNSLKNTIDFGGIFDETKLSAQNERQA